MARLSAAASVPAAPEIFWRTSAFRWGTALTALMASFFLLKWFERENGYYLEIRRLEEDARLGPLAKQIAARIEEAQNRGELKDPEAAERNRVPQALWLGRVTEFVEIRDAEGRSAPGTLYLGNPILLKGTRGRGDSQIEVKAGRRDYVFKGALPKPRETWLVSVWRDRTGINAIHFAERYDPRGSPQKGK